METAVETRSVDTDALLRVAIGRVLAPFVSRILMDAISHLQIRIHKRIETYYSMRAFQVSSRLDVVTFKDPNVQGSFDLLRYRGYSEMTWNIFSNLIDMVSWTIQFVSQFTVLVSVFKGHKETTFLIGTTAVRIVLDALGAAHRNFFFEGGQDMFLANPRPMV